MELSERFTLVGRCGYDSPSSTFVRGTNCGTRAMDGVEYCRWLGGGIGVEVTGVIALKESSDPVRNALGQATSMRRHKLHRGPGTGGTKTEAWRITPEGEREPPKKLAKKVLSL